MTLTALINDLQAAEALIDRVATTARILGLSSIRYEALHGHAQRLLLEARARAEAQRNRDHQSTGSLGNPFCVVPVTETAGNPVDRSRESAEGSVVHDAESATVAP